MRYRELIESHRDELATLITEEHGKTLADATGSVQRGLEVVEFAMGIPHLLKGEYSEEVGTSVDSHSLRQPLGVCTGIRVSSSQYRMPHRATMTQDCGSLTAMGTPGA